MDQGKIDTNRAVFGFEDELKAYLIAFALEYASLRNRAESDAYNKWQSENRANGEKWLREFNTSNAHLLANHCTDKERVYSGFNFGFPSKFDGIEQAIESSAEIKNKSRAEVYFKTANKFAAEYLFVFVRKGGIWRIDNAKRRWYNSEKYNSIIL
ncbi:MAG: RhsIA family immunity protein [Erysipelotrichaceae bacterium]|jgi:hypothetical protein|nr:RhsIA family immunity protein [Erysipelotrichaceae bacterium]